MGFTARLRACLAAWQRDSLDAGEEVLSFIGFAFFFFFFLA